MLRPLEINYKPKEYIPALDGIRGLAIILVLLYHCFPTLYKAGTGIGWVGVDLFFVLSGFLITGILLDTKEGPGYFRNFFLRRILRIFPLYYLFLFIFFLVLPLLSGTEWINSYHFYYTNQIWYWLYIPNWLIVLQNDWPAVEKPILDHLWSVSIEEQFYLVWPIMVYFLNRKNLGILCLFLIIASIVLRNLFVEAGLNYSSSYVFTFARLDALSLGALTSILIRIEIYRKTVGRIAPYVLYLSAFAILFLIYESKSLSLKNEYFIRFGYTLIAVFFTALLLHVLSNSNFRKATESKILCWFGKYSYGIYIYHWFMYPLLVDEFDKLLNFIPGSFFRGLAISTLIVSLILVTAILSWYLLEKHFIKLKKHIGAKTPVFPTKIPA